MSDSPQSTYDLLYEGLSDADRAQLDSDLTSLLKENVKQVNEELILGVQKAATAAYQNLLANPWENLLLENGGTYGFVRTIANGIWKSLLQTNPRTHNEYSMRELLDVWKRDFPGELKEIADTQLLKRIESLEESLAFERRINSNR